MRVTEAECEMTKSPTESAGIKDMSAFCKDIIRRELRERGFQPDDNAAGKQPPMIPECDDTETDSCNDEYASMDSSSTEGKRRSTNTAACSF